MSAIESIKQTASAAASDPKVSSVGATTIASIGAAFSMDMIQGAFGLIVSLIGALVGLYAIRVHHMNYKLLKRAWDNGEPPPKK